MACMAVGSAQTRRAAEGGLRALEGGELPTSTVALAKFLIGKVLVRDGGEGRVSGRIVETEAYPPGDDACHARSGRTRRNASLFLHTGHVYVYRAYGISMMLNISSEVEGVGAGVLIRAVEPIAGIDIMRRRRGIDDVYRLTRGPGCLAQAFGIDLSAGRHRLCRRQRAVACRRRRPSAEDRQLGAHRHHAQCRHAVAVFRARQSLGQRSGAPERGAMIDSSSADGDSASRCRVLLNSIDCRLRAERSAFHIDTRLLLRPFSAVTVSPAHVMCAVDENGNTVRRKSKPRLLPQL